MKYSVLEFAVNVNWINIGANIKESQWMDFDVSGKYYRSRAYIGLSHKLTKREDGRFTMYCNRTPL
jgi:hypothetical protein